MYPLYRIHSDIPLEELHRQTSFQEQPVDSHAPSVASTTISSPCPSCSAYQEHARFAYKMLASRSDCQHKAQKLERQKKHLERINAEQQTYVSVAKKRCMQSAERLVEKEALVRQLQEELARMKEQYRLVVESSKVGRWLRGGAGFSRC